MVRLAHDGRYGVERDGYYTYVTRWHFVDGETEVVRDCKVIGHVGQDGDRWWYRPVGTTVRRRGVKSRARCAFLLSKSFKAVDKSDERH